MANANERNPAGRGLDPTIDEITDVYAEAAQVYEQALVAIGQGPLPVRTATASTSVRLRLKPDLSSESKRPRR